MKPPTDRRLDLYGTGTDLPAQPKVPRGVRGWLVFAVATALGFLSSALAWQFARWLNRPEISWQTLAILNFAYWYLWALVTPAIVWLSQRIRFERGRLGRAFAIHLPLVIVAAVGHIASMQAVQWWLAAAQGRPFAWWNEVQRATLQYIDWEMITYWAIVGLSHALLYYRESRGRAVRAAQLEVKLAEAQLTTLQQQLHPHFLFNTLHAISALMHKDVEAADRTLMGLSDLLRLTLENLGRSEVTLQTELDFLSKYLQIEQTRFMDRLTVRFDVQPEALDTRVPSLLLQPLVENAIKHGVAKKAGPGHIDISARRDGDKLHIEVRDNGAGLSEDALTALQKGIGVSTTRARLQHLFGADFRFEFHRLQEGLAVIVAVPWRTAQETPATAEGQTGSPGTDNPRPPLSTYSTLAVISWPVFSFTRRKTS